MKSVRIPPHTIDNLRAREIPFDEVRRTIDQPERIVGGLDLREIYMRRYFDAILNEEMLLRVIVEETEQELVIVTAYKTSKIDKYLRGPE